MVTTTPQNTRVQKKTRKNEIGRNNFNSMKKKKTLQSKHNFDKHAAQAKTNSPGEPENVIRRNGTNRKSAWQENKTSTKTRRKCILPKPMAR